MAAAVLLGRRAAAPHARAGDRRRTACSRSTPTPRTTCGARVSPSAHFPRTILFDPLMNFPAGGVAIWPPLFDLALAAPARLAHGAAAPAGRRRARARRGFRSPWRPAPSRSRACSAGGSTARSPASRPRSSSRSVPGTSSGRSTRTPTSTRPNRSAACSRSGSSCASREQPDSPGNARREAAAGRRARARGPDLAGRDLLGRDLRALARLRERASPARSTLRAAVWTLGLPAVVDGRGDGGVARLALASPDLRVLRVLPAALSRGAARRDRGARPRGPRGRGAARRAASSLAGARGRRARGGRDAALRRGTSRRASSTASATSRERRTRSPARRATSPIRRTGSRASSRRGRSSPTAPGSRSSSSRSASSSRRWPSSPGPRAPARRASAGVHVALAVWGAVTLFLALSQRLNVYYAAPLAALTLVETVAARVAAAGVAPAARSPRPLGVALALPMAPGLRDGARARSTCRARTSSHARADARRASARDRRLRSGPARPAALSAGARPRASSVLAPWSLGHFLLYEAELPVVANNFGYGFLDSIRFFLADSEEEALAIARRHRARWIVATDLVPAHERLRVVPRPAAVPRAASADGADPDAGLLRDDAVAPLRLRRQGRARCRASTDPAAFEDPAALPLAERDPPRRTAGSRSGASSRSARSRRRPEPAPHAGTRQPPSLRRRGLEHDGAELLAARRPGPRTRRARRRARGGRSTDAPAGAASGRRAAPGR